MLHWPIFYINNSGNVQWHCMNEPMNYVFDLKPFCLQLFSENTGISNFYRSAVLDYLDRPKHFQMDSNLWILLQRKQYRAPWNI